MISVIPHWRDIVQSPHDRLDKILDEALKRMDVITDEYLRAKGLKEVYPGYFEGDPRYENSGFTAEDRYLYDHPGTPKNVSKLSSRLPRNHDRTKPAWDEEQFIGSQDWVDTQPSTPMTRHVCDTEPADVHAGYVEFEPKQNFQGLWLCLVCRRDFARFPSEKAWRKEILGVRLSIVFRSPLACANCRVFRQNETKIFGHQGYRDFWGWVFALVQGEYFELVAKHSWGRRLYRWRRIISTRVRAYRGYFVSGN